jgi:hypothetical protein
MARKISSSGLPDAIFSNQKYQFWKFWRAMEDVGIFCGHLANFPAIWCIYGHLVCCTKKYLATLLWFLLTTFVRKSELWKSITTFFIFGMQLVLHLLDFLLASFSQQVFRANH